MDMAVLAKERRGQNGAVARESVEKHSSNGNKRAAPTAERHGHSALATLLVQEVDDYGSAGQGDVVSDSRGEWLGSGNGGGLFSMKE